MGCTINRNHCDLTVNVKPIALDNKTNVKALTVQKLSCNRVDIEEEIDSRDSYQHRCFIITRAHSMCLATTCLSELPDVAPPLDLIPCVAGTRCNGRVQPAPDSTSSSSKGGSSGKGAVLEVRIKPWCLGLLICLLGSALGAGIGLPLVLSAAGPMSLQQRLDAVRRILREIPLVDGHNDLPWNVRKFVKGQLQSFNFSSDLRLIEPWASSPWSQTDLPRMRQGLVGAQFWSAYIPCGARYLDTVQLVLEQVDLIKRMSGMYPKNLIFVSSVKDLLKTHQSGRIASLIGVEGGHNLGNSLAVLRMLYHLGARYLTLTHTCHTDWADCSLGFEGNENVTERSSGLTDFGKAVVREMNRLGMMIDLSHASLQTVKDVLDTSKAPVIFSHSSAFALCNTSRNVPDEVLKQLVSNRGVVMVSVYPQFLTCSPAANISDIIAHINYIREVAGIDHIGLGAGFDGINLTPNGFEDVSRYPHLLAALMEDPSWSELDIKQLAGLNIVRVFREVEEVRDKWRLAAVTPAEDSVPTSQQRNKRPNCTYMVS